MRLRYRVLQSRWPLGDDWHTCGFFYDTPERASAEARVTCHHNLDELQAVAHHLNACASSSVYRLETIQQALAELPEWYRVSPEIQSCEYAGDALSAALNCLEAKVLGLDHGAPSDGTQEGIRIFSGRANRPLAHAVARRLGLHLSALGVTSFPDGEVHVQIDDAVRQKDVFVIQPCSAPVNDHLMELALLVDAFRRASARSITAIIPYFPYARQERMARGREAISARVVATMLETMGTDRVIYVDIHADAIQGFFTVPVDPLQAFPILADYFQGRDWLERAVIVSPDVGRARLANRYAQALGMPLVLMHKRREEGHKTTVTHVIGDVEGKIPLLIDDVIAGGSVLDEVPALFLKGAREEVHLAITHPVLAPTALQLLDEPWVEELVVTDTIYVPPAKRHRKLRVVSVAPMLAHAIRGISHGESIGGLWQPDAPRKLGFY